MHGKYSEIISIEVTYELYFNNFPDFILKVPMFMNFFFKCFFWGFYKAFMKACESSILVYKNLRLKRVENMQF